MLPPAVEAMCPSYVGAENITLALSPSSRSPRAFGVVRVDVDYSRCAPAGPSPPLELLIQAPSQANVIRRIYGRSLPTSIAFTPREGGVHGVLLREIGHNRWLGRLRVDVAGT